MKLKTLKEICWENKIGLKSYMNLKAEAVKWVKYFRKIRDENRDIHIKNFNYGRIAGLMDFHNITEEDLI